jgi:ketosteroid isomerase-like protein
MTMMTSKETVLALYKAYASRTAAEIERWLTPDAVWIAPAGNATQVAFGLGTPEDAGAPSGSNRMDRDRIVRFMAYNFSRFFLDAKNELRCVVADGDAV